MPAPRTVKPKAAKKTTLTRKSTKDPKKTPRRSPKKTGGANVSPMYVISLKMMVYMLVLTEIVSNDAQQNQNDDNTPIKQNIHPLLRVITIMTTLAEITMIHLYSAYKSNDFTGRFKVVVQQQMHAVGQVMDEEIYSVNRISKVQKQIETILFNEEKIQDILPPAVEPGAPTPDINIINNAQSTIQSFDKTVQEVFSVTSETISDNELKLFRTMWNEFVSKVNIFIKERITNIQNTIVTTVTRAVGPSTGPTNQGGAAVGGGSQTKRNRGGARQSARPVVR